MFDDLAAGRPVKYGIHVPGYDGEYGIDFHPRPYNPDNHDVSLPELWPIVSSYELAVYMKRFGADALSIEGPKTGGHNAPLSGHEDPFDHYLDLGLLLIVAGGEASR